jgi:hypothetical protein
MIVCRATAHEWKPDNLALFINCDDLPYRQSVLLARQPDD